MDQGNIKTIKCSLKSILKNKIGYERFLNCIKRTNELTFLCSHFIRAYILYCFENEFKIPKINNAFIRKVFKMISKKSCGPKGQTDDALEKFYKKLKIEIHLSSKNLSYILNYERIKLEIAYKNNIKVNYLKYLRQYVNETFDIPKFSKLPKEEFKKLNETAKNEYKLKLQEYYDKRSEVIKKLAPIKDDLIEGTNKSKEEVDWIQKTRTEVFPEMIEGSLKDDIDLHPYNYIESMLNMNRLLEDKEHKLFQALPLRTSIYDKFVSFDTSAIKDIFGEIKNTRKLDKSNKNIWKKYFNLKKIHLKGYIFNELISTDGTSVSVSFIKADAFVKKKIKHDKMTEASAESKRKLKKMTSKERDKYIKNKNIQTKSKELEIKREHKKKVAQSRKTYKKLSKEEQGKVKLKMRLNNEFKYIEDVIKDTNILKYLKKQYNNNNVIAVDPGKRTILTCLNKDLKRFNYRCRRRLKELKRLKYTKLMHHKYTNLIKKNDLVYHNYELKFMTYKTTHFDQFKKYFKSKIDFINQIDKDDLKEYSKYHNKLKWYTYINKRRHEDKLLNELKYTYGEDAIFVIGDWSYNGCAKGISAPNMGIKRVLSKMFEVYTIDEFNTSKINYLTEKEMKHKELKVKIINKGVEQEKVLKMYSILTYQMGKQMRCINRDYNATLNMLKIIESLLNGKSRPNVLCRKKETQTPNGNKLGNA